MLNNQRARLALCGIAGYNRWPDLVLPRTDGLESVLPLARPNRRLTLLLLPLQMPGMCTLPGTVRSGRAKTCCSRFRSSGLTACKASTASGPDGATQPPFEVRTRSFSSYRTTIDHFCPIFRPIQSPSAVHLGPQLASRQARARARQPHERSFARSAAAGLHAAGDQAAVARTGVGCQWRRVEDWRGGVWVGYVVGRIVGGVDRRLGHAKIHLVCDDLTGCSLNVPAALEVVSEC